jgi:hypothetical protein
MRERMTRQLVIDDLRMAQFRRRPARPKRFFKSLGARPSCPQTQVAGMRQVSRDTLYGSLSNGSCSLRACDSCAISKTSLKKRRACGGVFGAHFVGAVAPFVPCLAA